VSHPYGDLVSEPAGKGIPPIRRFIQSQAYIMRQSFLIYSIRKSPIETSGFKRKSYQWESYFISDESYFLDKIMHLSTRRNLRIETNFRPNDKIKFSGTETERRTRAFAYELLRKIQVVWDDSLEINPQK